MKKYSRQHFYQISYTDTGCRPL